MSKKFIYILLSLLVLSGCSGSSEDGSSSNTSGKVKEPSEIETVTIPPLPEDGIVTVDGDVLYSDEEVIIHTDTESSYFVNGSPVNKEEYSVIVEQISDKDETPEKPEKGEEITHETAGPDVTDKDIISEKEENTKKTDKTEKTENTKKTENPNITLVIGPDVPGDKKDPNEIESSFECYTATGDTSLNITKILVYNSAYPGDDTIQEYKPGDSLLVNIWCDNTAYMTSMAYIVPADTEHKSSYGSSEYITKQDMFFFIQTNPGQIFYELTIPSTAKAGTYELRFVCGEEEGYFTFKIV